MLPPVLVGRAPAKSAIPALRRPRCSTVAALATALLCACVTTNYGVPRRYQAPDEAAKTPVVRLLSAQISRHGAAPEAAGERVLEPGVAGPEADELVLVFSHEVDPLTVAPGVFGVLRADGRRVAPIEAVLGPANESDENRSVILRGAFGGPGKTPVAVHVLGRLFAESGESLRGLDAEVRPVEAGPRPLLVEQLEAGEGRCPEAAQVLRTHWSVALTEVGADDLAGVELRLEDGNTLAPTDFDDQAQRAGESPCEPFAACLGPADDNVLDLCVGSEARVVELRVAAGLFRDREGHESEAAEIDLRPPAPKPAAEAGAE